MCLQIRWFGAFAVALALSHAAVAQQMTPEDIAKEGKESWEAAQSVAVAGPAQVRLAEQGSFNVPAGVIYVPVPAASRIMRSLGNRVRSDFIGLAVSPGEDWLASLFFVKQGYVADSDAKEWSPDELLQSLKDGTAKQNAERVSRGFPTLEVMGWITPPVYDSATHRLVWSAAARESGQSGIATVNYNTYLLGREGYYELNFITTDDKINAEKAVAVKLLAALHFDQGKRYEDFNASTDQVAAFGLAALVGGVALKKLGFLAVAVAFLAKFAKAAVLLGIALIAGVARLFRRKKATGGDGEA
jgi:uncharacterized membrane-anchored protein